MRDKKLINRRNDITRTRMAVLGQGRGKKEKKLIQHGVFIFGHPFKYQPRPTGLNFVERTKHVAVLVV